MRMQPGLTSYSPAPLQSTANITYIQSDNFIPQNQGTMKYEVETYTPLYSTHVQKPAFGQEQGTISYIRQPAQVPSSNLIMPPQPSHISGSFGTTYGMQPNNFLHHVQPTPTLNTTTYMQPTFSSNTTYLTASTPTYSNTNPYLQQGTSTASPSRTYLGDNGTTYISNSVSTMPSSNFSSPQLDSSYAPFRRPSQTSLQTNFSTSYNVLTSYNNDSGMVLSNSTTPQQLLNHHSASPISFQQPQTPTLVAASNNQGIATLTSQAILSSELRRSSLVPPPPPVPPTVPPITPYTTETFKSLLSRNYATKQDAIAHIKEIAQKFGFSVLVRTSKKDYVVIICNCGRRLKELKGERKRNRKSKTAMTGCSWRVILYKGQNLDGNTDSSEGEWSFRSTAKMEHNHVMG
ncbi:hypothetical protein HK098_006811 [Nowakowskiella sp. JEL0407]|nr:hypothetical protein HK098_006811 [Nowakowskiella sp. JEL0407]